MLVCCLRVFFVCLFKDLFHVLERESMVQGGAQGEGEKILRDSVLSADPDTGFNPMALRL